MNFSCDKCQRRYSIADDKVRGKTVKVRCKNCQHVISVEGPPAEMEESTRVVSLADVERLREQDRSLAEEEAAQSTQGAVSAGSWEDEPTRAMPVGDAAAPWYVMVKGDQKGPLDDGALREMVAQGTVTARSYFWQQGMADWKRGQDLPALEGLFTPEEPPAPVEPVPPPEPVAPASSTSWQPEAPAESQTHWRAEPEPTPAPAAARAQPATPWAQDDDDTGPLAPSEPAPAAPAPLGELFSDLDLPASEARGAGSEGRRYDAALDDEHTPVNQEAEAPEPVTEQRPAARPKPARRGVGAKVALVLLLLVLLPVGLVIALTELQVVPLRVYRVDAEGRATPQPVSIFSAEGLGELRNVLAGHPSQPPPAPEPVAVPEPAPPAEPAPTEAPAGEGTPTPETPEAAAQAPGETALEPAPATGTGTPPAPAAGSGAEGSPAAAAPAAPAPTESEVMPSALTSGPPKAEVDRVVERSRSGFKSCIVQALRKNPKLRNGKLLLFTTVTSSGKVTKVAMDRLDIGDSPSAECFIERAQSIVFPSFSGGDVEVEIPLVLSARAG